jgi:hypothetical protein
VGTDAAAAVRWMLAQVGKPCLWDCKGTWTDPVTGEVHEAWDCSGLVADAARRHGGPDLRPFANTAWMWRELRPLVEPEPGCLVLYGVVSPADPGHLVGGHVMCWTGDGDGVVGACGASHSVLTLADAAKSGARVRTHDRRDYRGDFRGYRRMIGM